MTQPRIGFIGIGNMGGPMAGHIRAAGYPLVVFDTDPARGGKFAQEHACGVAATLAELGGQSDIVITMLPDGAVVRGVLFDQGLAGALAAGSIVIDMSSSDPVGTQETGARLAQRNVTMIDAPVSGGVPRAITGKLAIMIGHNDAAALARALPLLKTMGDRLFETGPLGSGHAMKALNNFCGASGYAATAEALMVGRKFGLDPTVIIDVINASTGRNFSSEMLFKDHVLGEKFGTGFSVGLLAKDVKTAADLAKHLGVSAPLGQTVASLWAAARDDLGPNADHTKAITSWDKK